VQPLYLLRKSCAACHCADRQRAPSTFNVTYPIRWQGRQGHPVDNAPAGSVGEQYACAERRAVLIFSSARSLLGTSGICRSLAEKIVSTTDIRGSKHYILYVPGPTCRGPVPLCMPRSAIKGEACDVTHARNLRLASSYKPSSNTSHSGVGYYALAAQTTLTPRVFLCSAPSLHQSSETPKSLLISRLRAGALRHPAGDLLSDNAVNRILKICHEILGGLVSLNYKYATYKSRTE
jgi:hypothetical protein